MRSKWLTVREYCKKKNIKNPQVIYNKIAMGKFDGEWREIEKTVTLKQVKYERPVHR